MTTTLTSRAQEAHGSDSPSGGVRNTPPVIQEENKAEIGRRSREALRRIAEEDVLNPIRIRSFGYNPDFDPPAEEPPAAA